MKKTLVKSIKISFQEKTSKGFVDRSFDTPKETVGTNVAGRLVRPEGSQSGVGALHLEWQYGTSGAGCLALEPDEKES